MMGGGGGYEKNKYKRGKEVQQNKKNAILNKIEWKENEQSKGKEQNGAKKII